MTVHAKVTIALGTGKSAKTNDLRLSIQSHVNSVWTDAGSKLFSTTATAQSFEFDAAVAAGRKLRLVVTGQQSASEAGTTTYAVSWVGLTVAENP